MIGINKYIREIINPSKREQLIILTENNIIIPKKSRSIPWDDITTIYLTEYLDFDGDKFWSPTLHFESKTLRNMPSVEII